jgi:hypothetical protein
MDIKAVVVGAKVSAKKLAAAAPKGSHPRVIENNAMAWILLPLNASSAAVNAVARTLRVPLAVFEVEMPLGLRGEELTASRYEAPGRKRERDLTDVAAEKLEEWTVGAGAYDEDVAARELVWFLAGQA